jgi:mRNA-degrading endonuclease toxin of MazEF toxin-antitoxin module
MEDFDLWNKLKQYLNRGAAKAYFKTREIWFCSVGKNIGHEQNGHHEFFERPVLIFARFDTETFLGIPISSKGKAGSWYFPINYREGIYYLLLNQIRLFDSKRLSRKIAKISMEDYLKIKKKFIDIL